jgi:antitoxin component YwqK of YwqJK toxin-antitoxin module
MKRLLTGLLCLISFSFSQDGINFEFNLIERENSFYTKDTHKLYSGKVFSLYDDQKIKSEGSIEDGKMIHKTESKWYENGQKRSEVPYKNGKVDGLITWWYKNGQKNFEGTYRNGLKEGLNTSWKENGEKSFESNYTNHKRNGPWMSWYDNGQKNSEGTYKDGKVDGLEIYWYQNGQKYREVSFINGELISEKSWNEDGSKKE